MKEETESGCMEEVECCQPEAPPVDINIKGIYLELNDGSFKKTAVKFTRELAEDMKLECTEDLIPEVNRMIFDELLKEINIDLIPITDVKSINIVKEQEIDYLINKEESNLTWHARRELELIKAFTKEGDFYGGMTGDSVMELIELFSKQGHSGMSASIVRGIFNKLANFDTISPLTFKDDEWNESRDGHFQNKRNSAVFKHGKDGKPYYIDAYYKKTQTGSTWSGTLELKNGWYISNCYIRPENTELKKFCIDVFEREVQKDNEAIDEPGSGWWVSYPVDMSQVVELSRYYDLKLEKRS